ncbi:siderophore biosynthesis protein [Legionella sp. PATHC032]|uniref:IucA/IucC family protein n=1 Tax=Legionella sp. PATHC032 TaxID=2992039 RepID=UPI001B0E32EB|nr:IucA/IucC family protein [Legionella sp. PATHC032]MCW8422731.1 siderophore biosynthesis protein [Legionella sp. PATHC032]HAZ7574086.1 siderophore biosynthesis protein [Legionella pneumophila]HBA1636312.1 siderophore biosynthesis protein [Legionella pneumophila]
MALAYGNFHELSHQLRFLLFEIGIGLPQNSVDYFITLAHKNTLNRLQHASIKEKLIQSTIASHHVHDFIDQLQIKLKNSMPESTFFQWRKIRAALDESIANEALAYAYRQNWNTQLRNEAMHYKSLWAWINNELSPYQTLLFLEQWGSLAHPYHPAFRAKIGFTRREVLQNSPEFQAKVSVHWCALNKTKIQSIKPKIDYINRISQEFPKEYFYWREKLLFSHINPDEYYPIPVHPWQWRNQLQMAFASLIDNKSLILLPHHQTLIPSLSPDIMMPTKSTQYTLKLATTLSTSLAGKLDNSDNVVSLTNWLDSLLAKSNYYQNTLFICKNLESISADDQTLSEYNRKKLLFGLYQNPLHKIRQNQRVVPLPALLTHSPCTNTPLLIEIIKASDLHPMAYFTEYCYKMLFGQLHLLLKYGLALEVEQHNILVIFDDNKPQGIIIKEPNNLKICHHELFKNVQKPDVSDHLSIYTKDLNKIRTLFIQGTLKNHLNHLIGCLRDEYQISEKTLWGLTRQTMQTVFKDLPKDIEPRILSWQQHLLLHDNWEHQPELLLSLHSNLNPNITIKESNPLSET